MSPFDEMRKKALNSALDSFSSDAAKVTKLTQDQLKRIIPEGVDPSKFFDLLNAVKDATKSNKEKAELIRNTACLAEIAVNVISETIL